MYSFIFIAYIHIGARSLARDNKPIKATKYFELSDCRHQSIRWAGSH